MNPLQAIGFSIGGVIVLLLLSSLVTANTKDTATSRICPVAQEALRQCKMCAQDRTPMAAAVHASTGAGMIQSVRLLLSEDAVVRKCRIDPGEVFRLCNQYRLQATKGKI